MDGDDNGFGLNGFSNMSSINVGNIEWKPNFSSSFFCTSWPTGIGKTIYANSYEVANSWQKGGISTWETSVL